jgi:hypothetical protein
VRAGTSPKGRRNEVFQRAKGQAREFRDLRESSQKMRDLVDLVKGVVEVG